MRALHAYISLSADHPPPPITGCAHTTSEKRFLQPQDQDGNHAGASGVEGGDRRRDDLYACEVRTKIQSLIDNFSLNFCFLADEVMRIVAGD